jgi:hypothetical protein
VKLHERGAQLLLDGERPVEAVLGLGVAAAGEAATLNNIGALGATSVGAIWEQRARDGAQPL